MLYVIPITEDTLDLIEVLNDGIRPELENEATFFVYEGQEKFARIVTKKDVDEMPVVIGGSTTKIFHIA